MALNAISFLVLVTTVLAGQKVSENDLEIPQSHTADQPF